MQALVEIRGTESSSQSGTRKILSNKDHGDLWAEGRENSFRTQERICLSEEDHAEFFWNWGFGNSLEIWG